MEKNIVVSQMEKQIYNYLKKYYLHFNEKKCFISYHESDYATIKVI